MSPSSIDRPPLRFGRYLVGHTVPAGPDIDFDLQMCSNGRQRMMQHWNDVRCWVMFRWGAGCTFMIRDFVAEMQQEIFGIP